MKTITSFIASSFLALTLVTAHGAVNTINPVGVAHIPTTSPTEAETIAFEKDLQEKSEQPVILEVHENNDGAKVTVPSGTLVKVILEDNSGSTGFDWTWNFSAPDILEFQNIKIIKQPPAHFIGAPTQKCWSFIATASDQTTLTTTLTFSLARPWKKDASPAKTVHFDITVE
ncbi:MAG: protease inhibitor I42 family protein [Verrucomicrobiae bacterium]|nr:protease inhibitor I42 family protein [Verrucomicrobiae bacterium]